MWKGNIWKLRNIVMQINQQTNLTILSLIVHLIKKNIYCLLKCRIIPTKDSTLSALYFNFCLKIICGIKESPLQSILSQNFTQFRRV